MIKMDLFKSKLINFALEILTAPTTISNRQNPQQLFFKLSKNQIHLLKSESNKNKMKLMIIKKMKK